MLEATVQKIIRIGMAVRTAKKIHVLKPPPTFHEKYSGTNASKAKSSVFEKPSLPAASAGRGAFLIDRYYENIITC